MPNPPFYDQIKQAIDPPSSLIKITYDKDNNGVTHDHNVAPYLIGKSHVPHTGHSMEYRVLAYEYDASIGWKCFKLAGVKGVQTVGGNPALPTLEEDRQNCVQHPDARRP